MDHLGTPKKNISWTKQECREKALLCDCRYDFKRNYNRQYQKALRLGWLEVVWSYTGKSEKIWNTELEFKRQIKDYRYTPNICFSGSVTECFKCHGNCKILKKREV